MLAKCGLTSGQSAYQFQQTSYQPHDWF